MVKTKSVYDPAEASDGVRVLVMRYWPRGVKKGAAGLWLKDLGTSPELIKDWKAGKITWGEFRKRYTAELKGDAQKAALEQLKAIIKDSGKQGVTLLCSCREEDRCHRSILKDKLFK